MFFNLALSRDRGYEMGEYAKYGVSIRLPVTAGQLKSLGPFQIHLQVHLTTGTPDLRLGEKP